MKKILYTLPFIFMTNIVYAESIRDRFQTDYLFESDETIENLEGVLGQSFEMLNICQFTLTYLQEDSFEFDGQNFTTWKSETYIDISRFNSETEVSSFDGETLLIFNLPHEYINNVQDSDQLDILRGMSSDEVNCPADSVYCEVSGVKTTVELASDAVAKIQRGIAGQTSNAQDVLSSFAPVADACLKS